MLRRARVMLAHIPVHVIQRGNNRQACFYAEENYRFYLEWLCEYAEREACQVHAYALMTNHAHLLLTSERSTGVGRLMKRLGQRYVQYINRSYRRTGTLWEGRYKSCLAGEEAYVFSCYRYIELNPVRAGMVAHPAKYRWSSYRANAQGEASELLTAHSLYKRLSNDAACRCRAYRELFRHELDLGVVDQIREAANGNYALGSERFREQVAAMLGRRVTPGKSGRPAKRNGGWN